MSDYYMNIKKQSGRAWLNQAIASAEHDIDYHTKALAEAQQRDADRQKWFDDHKTSVPYESPKNY